MTRSVVLDTQVVLDLFVFDDPQAQALRQALDTGELQWLATTAMREELVRVLGYPQIVRRLLAAARPAQRVLQSFDGQARLVAAPEAAPVRCRDPDDQKFIDLAVARRALLLSKDRAVLALRQRLVAHAVRTQASWLPTPETAP